MVNDNHIQIHVQYRFSLPNFIGYAINGDGGLGFVEESSGPTQCIVMAKARYGNRMLPIALSEQCS